MNKKSIFFIVILLFVALAGYYYYKKYNDNYERINGLSAIPERTTTFFYTNNIRGVNHKLDSLSYLKILEKSHLFSTVKQNITFVDSFLLKLENNGLQYNKIIFSINNTGSANFDILNIVEFNQQVDNLQVKKAFPKSKYLLKHYKYQEFKVYILTNIQTHKKTCFSLFNNLLIISKNEPLVEASLNSTGLEKHKTSSKEFKSLNLNAIEKNDLHIFVDNKNNNDLSTLLFKSEFLEKKPQLFKNKNWSYTALNFKPKKLSFSTNTSFSYGDGSAIDFISNSTVSGFTLDRFLPNNTAYFEAYNSKNNVIYKSNDISYKYFRDWLDEEFAFFCLETFDKDYLKRSGLVLKTKNIDTAKVNLYMLNKEMSPVDEFDGKAIYKMNVSVLSKIFKSNLFEFKKPFFVIVGKYVVFSDEKNVLKTCIQKFESNKFLKGDNSFQKFINYKKANKIVYLNPQKCKSTLNGIFNEDFIFSDFGKLKIETFVSDSIILEKGSLDFEIEKVDKTTLIWETELESTSSYTAQVVKNANTNQTEIFTQDNKNIVYLINQSGKIIFKKELKEKILGKVFQVDLYKNNKLQYVFSTKRYIYMLDRKGRFVEGFPLKLPSEASNSILVVNYDNAKRYRYFIACQNNNIYGYEADGRPLDSWSPLSNIGIISNSIKHTIFEGKDYIFFNNTNGDFYAFNRKGEKRFLEINLDVDFVQSFETTIKGFINFGKGSIYKVDLKGKTTAKILEDSTFNIFTNYSEQDAFAISSNNKFKLAKSKWTILGEKQLNDDIVSIEKHKLNGSDWFLINCKQSVYLINDLGEIHPDFPMISDGNVSLVNIYNNKSKTLIINNGNKLKAYSLVIPE